MIIQTMYITTIPPQLKWWPKQVVSLLIPRLAVVAVDQGRALMMIGTTVSRFLILMLIFKNEAQPKTMGRVGVE